jgi:hypothetical protein
MVAPAESVTLPFICAPPWAKASIESESMSAKARQRSAPPALLNRVPVKRKFLSIIISFSCPSQYEP